MAAEQTALERIVAIRARAHEAQETVDAIEIHEVEAEYRQRLASVVQHGMELTRSTLDLAAARAELDVQLAGYARANP